MSKVNYNNSKQIRVSIKKGHMLIIYDSYYKIKSSNCIFNFLKNKSVYLVNRTNRIVRISDKCNNMFLPPRSKKYVIHILDNFTVLNLNF